MGDLPLRDLIISSSKRSYEVKFHKIISENNLAELGTHFIVDKNVYQLWSHCLSFPKDNILVVSATENNKTYEYVETLLKVLKEMGLSRNSTLVAIGGGIIQDITCFISSIWMRGIPWVFVPTTLLAQADSCIGSKSSLNFGSVKNLLGTFNPPNQIYIDTNFLLSLTSKEIDSGVGEIIKLYIIDGRIIKTREIHSNLEEAIFSALRIKQEYIEIDEFDENDRQILNYGHCFGHAIEIASNYNIPHGIAVLAGINFANLLASKLEDSYLLYNFNILENIYLPYIQNTISFSDMYDALKFDKKNTKQTANIIMPNNPTRSGIGKRSLSFDKNFEKLCIECFREIFK